MIYNTFSSIQLKTSSFFGDLSGLITSVNYLYPFQMFHQAATSTLQNASEMVLNLCNLIYIKGSSLLGDTVGLVTTINYLYPLQLIQQAISFTLEGVSGVFTTIFSRTSSLLGDLYESVTSPHHFYPVKVVQQTIVYPFEWVYSTAIATPAMLSESLNNLQIRDSLQSALQVPGQAAASLVTTLGTLLAMAWSKTSSLVLPRPGSAPPVESIDYDKIVANIMSNEKFLASVSSIAVSKVEMEANKFQEKLLEVTNSKEQDFSEVIQTYKSHIEQLKSGVEDEIKRMTEQVVKSNLEDSQKLSNEQTILIDNMNSKYTKMLKEAEAIQLDQSTKSDQEVGKISFN